MDTQRFYYTSTIFHTLKIAHVHVPEILSYVQTIWERNGKDIPKNPNKNNLYLITIALLLLTRIFYF